MFDSVGRNLDDEAAKRSAKSALITMLLFSCVGGGVVLAGLWTVKEIVVDQIVDEEITEVNLEEEAPDMAAPPPPPPPPPAAAASDEPEDETKTPDEMVEDVKKLDEEIKKDMRSDVKPAGVEGGVEGGVAGGVVGGVQGGVVGGVVGGQLGGGGPRVVHYSQVEVKKRVEPTYPAAARGLGLGEQKCKVTVDIDSEGVPTKVGVDGCPKVFHPVTEEAIYKWRWYPFKAETGAKVGAQFTIIVKYRETS